MSSKKTLHDSLQELYEQIIDNNVDLLVIVDDNDQMQYMLDDPLQFYRKCDNMLEIEQQKTAIEQFIKHEMREAKEYMYWRVDDYVVENTDTSGRKVMKVSIHKGKRD